MKEEQNFYNLNKQRKGQAEKRGIEYTLHPLTLQSLYQRPRCYYLNMPLNVKAEWFRKSTALTLDRKDCSKGYTKENVVACSWFANQLKNLVESGLITPEDIIECGKRIKEEL